MSNELTDKTPPLQDAPSQTLDGVDLDVVACVTALNEEVTIGGIVKALLQCPEIDRVHVVDDGSTDKTAEIAREAGAKVTSLVERVPVGEAIMHHLIAEPDECLIMWCDADLIGFRCDHASQLVQRYYQGDCSQSLSSRAVPLTWPGWLRSVPIRAFWIWAFGHITGERVMRRSDFARAMELARAMKWQEMIRGYGIVLFLKWYLDHYGQGRAMTYFDDLRQRQKYEKWGKQARWDMVWEWMEFIRCWIKIRLNAFRIHARKKKLGL